VVTDLAIRPARPDELTAVAELRWRWAQETGRARVIARDEFVPRFVAWARANQATHQCFVALRDEVVMGMARLAIVPRVPSLRAIERASGDVQCVYVVPEERDGGVGSRLIDAVLALARELGLERVTVHSSERAVPAYTRRGFAVSPQLLQFEP